VTTHLLCFELAGNLLAVDIESVRAVVHVAELRRLPDTPDFLLGLIDSPLGPVPLVDFARKFRLPGAESRSAASAVVVETIVEGRPTLMAVLADGACRVAEVEARNLTPPPPLGSGIRAEFLRAVAALNDHFVPILDLGRSLSATEQEALDGLGAERLAATAELQASRGQLEPSGPVRGRADAELLVFSIAGEKLALPLGQLREVAQHRSACPVPGTAEWIRGAINVRGEVVPLLDVAQRLGLVPSAPTARSFNLIAEVALGDGHAPVALAVDHVLDVTSERSTDLAGASMGLRFPEHYVCGLVRAREEFVPILDVAALFGNHRRSLA